jgi:hypothetical protein
MLLDLEEMVEVCCFEATIDEIKYSLEELIKEVGRLLLKINILDSRLVSISLQDIDTIAFEYYQERYHDPFVVPNQP